MAGSSASVSDLAAEWDDDQRMDFLFSDFKSNRDVNPMDWDSKMDFWAALVVRSCRRRGAACCSLRELGDTFRRKDRSPLGLPTVLQAMCRGGKLQRESDFAADAGWLSWGVGLLLVRPLRWTFSSVLGSDGVPPEETFVVVDLVKEKAAEVLAAYHSSQWATSPVVTFSQLAVLCKDVCADQSTLGVALLQLQREKKAAVSLHDGVKIVKFCRALQERVSPLSDVDLGVLQLQRSERLLEERLQTLGEKAEGLKEEARVLLRQGKKTQALRSLRSRKQVEKRVDNLSNQLESIRGILDRIDQSSTDKTVVQAYQAGVAALKLSLKDVTLESAENLVDQIQELCDTQDDVNQTISSLGAADDDKAELEEELESLLKEAEPDVLAHFPEVPTGGLRPSVPPRLEEDLSRLTLSDSGTGDRKTTTLQLLQDN